MTAGDPSLAGVAPPTPRSAHGRAAWLGLVGPAALALALLVLPGCEQTAGLVADAPGALFNAGPPRQGGRPVTVQAGGRDIRVAPPAGFCVDPGSVQPQGAATFVLIEDCALAGGAPPVSSNAAPNLPIPRPALVNGLVTLSIGEGPLFTGDGGEDAAFDELAAFLRSDAGRATAGMGGAAAAVRILEERRVDDTLYILVEDKGDQVVPVLGDKFWRGFTQVQDRAVIASLGVFDASRMADDTKLTHLAAVVASLKSANGDAVGVQESRLAAAAPRPSAASVAAARAGREEAPPPSVRAEAATPAPGQRLPVPRPGGEERRVAAAAPAPTPAPAAAGGDGGTENSPRRAPVAPLRPAPTS